MGSRTGAGCIVRVDSCKDEEEWPKGECPHLDYSDDCNGWVCTLAGKKIEDVGLCQYHFGFCRWKMRYGKMRHGKLVGPWSPWWRDDA